MLMKMLSPLNEKGTWCRHSTRSTLLYLDRSGRERARRGRVDRGSWEGGERERVAFAFGELTSYSFLGTGLKDTLPYCTLGFVTWTLFNLSAKPSLAKLYLLTWSGKVRQANQQQPPPPEGDPLTYLRSRYTYMSCTTLLYYLLHMHRSCHVWCWRLEPDLIGGQASTVEFDREKMKRFFSPHLNVTCASTCTYAYAIELIWTASYEIYSTPYRTLPYCYSTRIQIERQEPVNHYNNGKDRVIWDTRNGSLGMSSLVVVRARCSNHLSHAMHGRFTPSKVGGASQGRGLYRDKRWISRNEIEYACIWTWRSWGNGQS